MAYIEFKNVYKIYKMGEVSINALDDTNFSINNCDNIVFIFTAFRIKTRDD